jgi:hypothetical protein
MGAVRRTIIGTSSAGTMSLGDLRQFIASLDGLPDDAAVRARTSLRRNLRSVTVEEDDVGFREYIKAVSADAAETRARAPETRQVRGGRDSKAAKQTTSA